MQNKSDELKYEASDTFFADDRETHLNSGKSQEVTNELNDITDPPHFPNGTSLPNKRDWQGF